MTRTSLLAALAAMLVVPASGFAQHPPPPDDPHPPPPTGTFSCTASAVRVALLSFEPFVANPGTSPCRDDSQALLNLSNPALPVAAKALFAQTDANPGDQPGAHAEAGAARVTMGTGAQSISVAVLTAEADAACVGGEPTLSGSSEVVGLRAGGMPIIVTGDPQEIPLGPLGTIFLNEKVEENGNITTRAIRYDGPLEEIVVGEATADFEGDPCP